MLDVFALPSRTRDFQYLWECICHSRPLPACGHGGKVSQFSIKLFFSISAVERFPIQVCKGLTAAKNAGEVLGDIEWEVFDRFGEGSDPVPNPQHTL